METVIAGLLRDFEQGKMSRRQLIQSLAMAAAAVPTAAIAAEQRGAPTPATPPPPSQAPAQASFGKAPWKTVWLDHISFAVSDYKRSTEFYTNLMGWEIRNDNDKTQATLDINGIGGIIIRNGRATSTTPQAPSSTGQPAQPRPPITGVINHISWGVQPWDTEKVKTELERRGLKPRPDMVGNNFKSYHVTDPDGWDLQISNQTKESHSDGGL